MSEEVKTKVDGALIDVIDLESEVQEVTPARKLKLQAKSQEAIAKVQYEVMKEMLKQAEATVSLAQATGKMEDVDRINKLREHAENFGSVMTDAAQNQFMASLADDANKEDKQAVLSQFEDTLTDEERKNLIASLEDNVDFLREKMAEFDTYYSRMLQSSSRVLKTPDKRFKSLLRNGIVARIINKVKNKILGDNPIADTQNIEDTSNEMNRVFDEVGQQYNQMAKPMDRKYDFTDIDTAGIQEEVNKIFDGMKKEDVLDKNTDEIKDQVLNPEIKTVDEEEEKLKSILNKDVVEEEQDQDLRTILTPKAEDDIDLSKILKEDVEEEKEEEPEIDFDEPIFPEEDKNNLGIIGEQNNYEDYNILGVTDYKKLVEEAERARNRYKMDSENNYRELEDLIGERETTDEELARVEQMVKEKENVYNENVRRKEEAESRRKEAEEQVAYAKQLSVLNQEIAQYRAKNEAIERQKKEEQEKITTNKDRTEEAMRKSNEVTRQNNSLLRDTKKELLQLEALKNECEEIMVSGSNKVNLTETGKKALESAGIDLTSSNTYPFDTPPVSWVTMDEPTRATGRGRR